MTEGVDKLSWFGGLNDDAIEFVAKLQHSMSLHPCSNEQ